MSDRERTRAAAVQAIAGALSSWVLMTRVAIVILFGLTLVVFGCLALLHAVLLGLGLIGWPAEARKRDDERR